MVDKLMDGLNKSGNTTLVISSTSVGPDGDSNKC